MFDGESLILLFFSALLDFECQRVISFLAKMRKKLCRKDLHSPKVYHTFAPHLRRMLVTKEVWVSG